MITNSAPQICIIGRRQKSALKTRRFATGGYAASADALAIRCIPRKKYIVAYQAVSYSVPTIVSN